MTVKHSPTSPSSESSISRELSTAESVAPVYKTMEEFLKTIEKRAFVIAKISTSRHEDALDIVQETMFKMVEKYGSKPVLEWRPLFYRILNNKITDHYRRQAVRNKIFIWKSSDNDQSDDCFQSDIASSVERRSEEPDEMLMRQQRIERLAKGVQKLARRQREAFLLRSWECLSTRETAYAMGCTEGSVKTHYSRALEKLREQLAGYDYD
jgi:RNA polymerase sigma-70 factor (ECF subfamily)